MTWALARPSTRRSPSPAHQSPSPAHQSTSLAHRSPPRSVSGGPARVSGGPALVSGGPARPKRMRSKTLRADAASTRSGLVRRTAPRRSLKSHANSNGVASLRRNAHTCEPALCTGDRTYHAILTGRTDHATPRATESHSARGRSRDPRPRSPRVRARGESLGARSGGRCLGATTTARPQSAAGLSRRQGGLIRPTAGNGTCSRDPPPEGPLLTSHAARRSPTLSSERSPARETLVAAV